MMQGISRIAAHEMSHDYFIETYGSCSPSPTHKAPATLMPLAPAADLSNEERFLDDERASSDVEKVTSRRNRYSKKMKHHATREPLRATRPHGSQYLSMSQEDILSSVEASPGPTSSASSSSSTSSRRTTKFQNIANRLARRSFRVVPKKKTVEGPSHSEPLSTRPPTPNRLGAFLFKRSKSVSRQPPAECTSFRILSDDEQLSSVRPVASTPSRPQSRADRRSRVTRSMSMSPSTSLLVKPKNLQPSKRHSAYAPNDWETLSDGKQQQKDTICDGAEMVQGQGGKEDILQQILEQKQQILDEQRRFRDEVNPSRVRQGDSGSELDVTRKYESIRQNEETRVVAIVALLNRRKNSLRIKCDRFEKELQASSPTGTTDNNSSKEVSNTAADRLRFVKERARAFRRKLTVVEQCIDEQKDKMQLSAAKLELKCCVELFQMGLANDEAVLAKRGALARRHTGPAKTSSRPTLKAASSCDTLGSVDDTSVFEDSTPVSDFSLSFERSSPAQHLTSRTSSATQGQVSPLSLKSNLTLNDSCDKGAMRRSGRCRSIDYAITSDCDSGFDNGDTLSRSDISLDGTLSKSTGSIVSSCSQSGCQATTTCSITSSSNSASPLAKHNDVFYSPRQAAKTLDTIPDSCFESHDDVDRRVLAQIEDFEHFAEKRIRCLSNKGRIVPLKGGS